MAPQASAGDRPRDANKRVAARRSAILVLVAHTLVAVAFLFVLRQAGHDPRPELQKAPNSCRGLLPADNLFRLPTRSTQEAIAQVETWNRCDPQILVRARTAVAWDFWLVGLIVIGLILATDNLWTVVPPWRFATRLAVGLILVYALADLAENFALSRLLDGLSGTSPGWWMPWASAIKFGTVLSAAPLFPISFIYALGQLWLTRNVGEWTLEQKRLEETQAGLDEYRQRKRAAKRARSSNFLSHSYRRVKRWATNPLEVSQPPYMAPPAGHQRGICCSGGGIRSAAFNLGALQALQSGKGGSNKVETADWLAGVSGGAYIATAWVTARKTGREWDRLSSEEDHLRRHASYLAPGIGGKAWALLLFLVGFLLNVGLVTLFLGSLFVPFGWLVRMAENPRPSTGSVALAQGGCVKLRNGTTVEVLPGTIVHLADRARPKIATGATVDIGGQAHTTLIRRAGAASPPVTCEPDPDPDDPNDGKVSRPAIGGGIRADEPIVLLLGRSLPVRASPVVGCKIDPAAEPSGCDPDNAVSFGGEDAVLLLGAPRAILTSPEAALISRSGTVLKACGETACVELRPHPWLPLALLVLSIIALVVITTVVMSRPTQSISEQTQQWARWLFAGTAGSLFAIVVLPTLTVWAQEGRSLLHGYTTGAGVAGFVAILAALLAQVSPYLAGAAGAAKIENPLTKAAKKLASRFRKQLIRVATTIIGPAIVLGIAIAFSSWAAEQEFQPAPLRTLLVMAGVLLVLGSSADLNQWSLHPFYRDRLRSAFGADPQTGKVQDHPLSDLRPGGPRLLICAAVNLADARVTAPGRPVASWVFVGGKVALNPGSSVYPAEMGSDAMRQAPIRPNGSGHEDVSGLITSSQLPPSLRRLAWASTAVAVSGAAFSPSMGKMTRRERFLLALGNLRLGVWYPNPRYLAQEDERWWYQTRQPHPGYLAKEALGLHRADDRWLYLTDGGHYENLGLVELLRRGCREIFCFDASGDQPDTFGTLADAMRLAREELNIEIKLNPEIMKPDPETNRSPKGVCAGTIRFDGEAEASGWLVVAKLCVPATAPFDVIDLARSLDSFPTNPTADQLYTDQKFEAYRALGHHLGGEALMLATTIRSAVDAGSAVKAAVDQANQGEPDAPEPPLTPEPPAPREINLADKEVHLAVRVLD